MREQRTRITGRSQSNPSQSSSKLSVIASPSVGTIKAPDTRMTQTLAALEQLSGGVIEAVDNHYKREAERDYKLGQQMAHTGQEAPDPEDEALSSGYLEIAALSAGLEHVHKLEEYAKGIDVGDHETWSNYETPEDALDALLKSETASAIQGMPPAYAEKFLAPYVQSQQALISKKREDFFKFRKDDLAEKIIPVVTHELNAYAALPEKNPQGLRKVYDNMLQRLTQDKLMNRAEASQVLAERIGKYSVEVKNPTLVTDLLGTRDKDGILLAETNVGDYLRAAEAEAQRLTDAEFNTGRITLMDSVNKLVAKGTYGIDEAEQINQEIPDLYSNEQQAALMKQSRANRERAQKANAIKILNTQLYHEDKLYLIADGAEKNKILEAGHNEIREIGEINNLPEEEIIKQQVQHLSGNGAVSKEFSSIINNGAVIQGNNPNAELPDAFRKAFETFCIISAVNKSVALRHLTDKDAKANLLRFQAMKDANATDEEAYALVVQTAQDPVMAEKTYASSGKKEELQTALDDLDINNADSFFSFFDADVGELDNFNHLKQYANEQAETLVKLGLNVDTALEYMKSAVEGNYRVYNNRAVFTGGQQLPDDWEDFGDTVIKSMGLDSDDYFIEPARGKAGLVYVYQENGIWTGKAFKLSTTYQRYQDRDRPTLEDAKAALSKAEATDKQNEKELDASLGFVFN